MTVVKSRTREHPQHRRSQVLDAAIELAITGGYQTITREKVAETANISEALVNWYFTTMDQLKELVVQTAIQREILPIIAQGISVGDKHTSTISKELRQKVITFLNN